MILWIARRRRASVDFAPAPLAVGLPRSLRSRLAVAPRVLEVGALVLAIVALARPTERVALPAVTDGIDIALCIDASSSMAARDLDPSKSRLEVAKDAAARFVAGRADDRIGLIRFARFPDVVCPLTQDHAALDGLLAGIERVDADGPEDATGIGNALARAAQLLRAGTAKSKVAVLLTDGEENVATDQTPDEIGPVRAARACRELGVRAYVIAAGGGNVDTTQVERAAAATGGRLFAARDAAALAATWAEISALERAPFQEPRFRIEERFLPFLLAAIALLLTGRFLEPTALEVLP